MSLLLKPAVHISDTAIDEWIVDVESGCIPSAEVFLALCHRLTEVENERDELRQAVNEYATENADLTAMVRDLS